MSRPHCDTVRRGECLDPWQELTLGQFPGLDLLPQCAGDDLVRVPRLVGPAPARRRRTDQARYPYEVIAGALREQIESGELAEGEFLPGIKALAATHGVAVGTAHRAVNVLVESGQVEVVAGWGTRVGRVRPRAQ